MSETLGEAIGREFATIACLLRGGTPYETGAGIGCLMPGPGSTPTPTPRPVPRPPGTGTPPKPIGPTVDVPTVNTFPGPTPSLPTVDIRTPCPVFKPIDYLSLVGLSSQQLGLGDSFIPPYGYPSEGLNQMPASTATGIPVESSDFFRFRAFGSAGAIAVSFFGRVHQNSGVIVPFNHVLTTDALGTVFQTLPQPGVGILIGAAASVPLGSVTTGAVSAVGEIGRIQGGTFTPHTLLFSGQMSDQQPLSTTLASPAPVTNNPTFFLATDAGGTATFIEMTITPTPGKRLRIIRAKMFYDCSATAGNRQFTTWFTQGGNIIWEDVSDEVFTASQNAVMRGSLSGGSKSPTAALPSSFREMNMPLPDSLYFTTAMTVLMGVYGTQAGDTANDMIIGYEET